MLKRKWISKDLLTYADWLEVKEGIANLHPEVAAFDTETTGLHIKLDKPFLFQFGFLHPSEEKGYTFLVDLRYTENASKIISEWHEIAKDIKLYLGCNVTFDLHMLSNIGLDYREDNLGELQAYIRYSGDALHVSEGGPPLSLKDFAAKYVDISAKYHEQKLSRERTDKAKYYNCLLKNRLLTAGTPPEPFKAKSYTLQVIKDLFKDPMFDVSDLPEKAYAAYSLWLNEDLPKYLKDKVNGIVESDMIRYDTLDKETLYKYAHLDIVYTLESYLVVEPVLKYRHNESAVELENSLILPFLDMESTGFLADKEYLEASRIRVREYTLRKRKEIQELAGCSFKIGQHELVKKILTDTFKVDAVSTDKDALETLKNTLLRNDPDNKAIKFIDILAELRTLEKWYSTYILRFIKDLKHCDRLYTQINSTGAVSGRVTSDFQQFPKAAIVDDSGNEIFHPRKIVRVPDDCKALLYLDYSQIELRFQAMYTILVGNPDLNMCRAYMPYLCHDKDGVAFDYNNPEHIKRWSETWYTDETNEEWTPTDIHGATTLAAFASTGLTKDDPNFHSLRYIGKRVDFAKNYGASLSKIIEMFPEYSIEQCKEIDAAYYKAFPGVKAYHQYCFNRAQTEPYTSNLFGVRYYNVNGHKLRNILVQGSAAHFLKYRIRTLWEFLQTNNLKSRLQMQIHDELVFELNKEDPPIAKKLKQIMEDWPDALVPIVAEAEVTNTTWADKKEIDLCK